jgi:adenylyltransferase/sulfurtransferase
MMNDADLLRYSRHVFLPDIDLAGQQAFADARVAVVGVGGLGSIAAMLLASAGVGEILLIDPDVVELSNLPRQIAYTETDLGTAKVDALAAQIKARQASIKLRTWQASFADVETQLMTCSPHLLLDCTDHFQVRYQLNVFCRVHAIPLVFGAAMGWQGQYGVLDFAHQQSPCYHCLYPHLQQEQDSCSRSGVLASIPNVIGALQVTQALQLLLPQRAVIAPTLTIWQAQQNRWRTVAIAADPECDLCGHSVLSLTKK